MRRDLQTLLGDLDSLRAALNLDGREDSAELVAQALAVIDELHEIVRLRAENRTLRKRMADVADRLSAAEQHIYVLRHQGS